MTLLRRTVAESSTLERWLRRKAAIGNITKGDSLYHCGHGETAPLRGLFSSLTWAASVPPRRPHLLRASTVRAEGLTQPWAAAGSVLRQRRRCADNAPLSRPSQVRWVYWTLAGSSGDTRLCLCKIRAPVLLRRQSLGVSPKTALRNALIGATNCV